MSDRITPPLFGLIDNDVNFFTDARDAAAYIEADDVENGEWRLFDSLGNEFRLITDGNDVVISETPIGEDEGYLRSRLRDALAYVPMQRRRISLPDIGVASLPQLVDEFTRLNASR